MAQKQLQDQQSQRARDPEDRSINKDDGKDKRERAHDKTLADSFPTSDPPSSIPDPGEEDIPDRVA